MRLTEEIAMSLGIDVYVGCALRELPEGEELSFLSEVDSIRSSLRKAGFNVIEFIGLGDHDAEYVYREDIARMMHSQLVVAVCDYPSTGLGIEIGKAMGHKPILAVSRNSDISKMVTGAPKNEKNVLYLHYQDVSEVVEAAKEIVRVCYK